MSSISVETRISQHQDLGKTPRGFSGFQALSSNTTYTPNQFFDVCIRNSSRGVVRLVGYLTRKTLGWCDRTGKPQEDQIRTPYRELVQHAGISRDMIRKALDEAVGKNFIECVRAGMNSRAGEAGQSSLHQLRWDDSGVYHKKPESFPGFFEGEGNRTYVPNEFFDVVVKNEPLAVIKVVGAVVRASIGFESRRGHRRQNAQLSFTDIQRFTGLKKRSAVSEAIKMAIEKRYIVRLQEGVFSNDKRQQRSAVYSLCWADGLFTTGQKKEPESDRSEMEASQKREPGMRSEKGTGSGQKWAPENQSEKGTSIKRKPINETNHKQSGSDFLERKELLLAEGLNPSVAKKLAENHSIEEIQRQIDWIDQRNPKSRGGLLKMAIEQSFQAPKPESERKSEPRSQTENPPAPESELLLSQIENQLDRDAHKQRHLKGYFDFLKSEEARIEQQAAERYTNFKTTREYESRAMADKSWVDDAYLDKFSSEEAFLKALQKHFRLQDFWQWDRAINPTPFESIAAKMSISSSTSELASR